MKFLINRTHVSIVYGDENIVISIADWLQLNPDFVFDESAEFEVWEPDLHCKIVDGNQQPANLPSRADYFQVSEIARFLAHVSQGLEPEPPVAPTAPDQVSAYLELLPSALYQRILSVASIDMACNLAYTTVGFALTSRPFVPEAFAVAIELMRSALAGAQVPLADAELVWLEAWLARHRLMPAAK